MKKQSHHQKLNMMPVDLVPAIVQDANTNEVLMLAYMNAESLALDHRKGRDVVLVTQSSGVVA